MSSEFEFATNFDVMDAGSIGGYDEFFGEEFDLEDVGVNPQTPTDAKPGSDDKVDMLAARYAAGLPLWHDKDRYDHGPAHVPEEQEV